jgi:5-methylcytosine-specific restriction endonuclease McrA
MTLHPAIRYSPRQIVQPAVTPGVSIEGDHIIPWSKGGETVMENLQTLCFACNQGKTNHHHGPQTNLEQ